MLPIERTYDKGFIGEEPCEVKTLRHGFEDKSERRLSSLVLTIGTSF